MSERIPPGDHVPAPSVLAEADQIINGARQAAYGPPRLNLDRTAALWSVVIGSAVTAEQVCLCMALLKVSRQIHRSKRDNLVDAAGYLALIERLDET